MKLLEPLTIRDVAFASRQILDMRRIDQFYFQSSLLQDLERRDPINSRRFHDDRLDVVFAQPVGHPVQIAGKGIKLADIVHGTIFANGHEVKVGADIDAGGMEIDPF